MTTRRAFLAGIAAAPAASLGFSARAQAGAISSVRVDYSPLLREGFGPNAGVIAGKLQATLSRSLGATRQRGGATLHVHIRSISLAAYAGGDRGRWGGGGGSASDSLDSVATLLDGGGRVVATYPVLSNIPSSSGGAWYLPDIDQRRLDALIANNAQWIAKYVGG